MNSARLPKSQELQVLSKLSSDDDYRARFENDPASALKELGVDTSTLDADSLKPGKLADKATIADTQRKVTDGAIDLHACMIVPFLRTRYGKAD